MLRQSDVWLFKEVDARLLGWEVYFPKQTFLQETGIVLKVGASKSVSEDQKTAKPKPVKTPLASALSAFLRNTSDFITGRANFLKDISDDEAAVREYLATEVKKRRAPGWLEGFRATVTAIKANEAVRLGKRIELSEALFQI